MHISFVVKPEGYRPIGKSGLMRVDSIKINFGEKGWSGMDCIDLAQVKAVMTVRAACLQGHSCVESVGPHTHCSNCGLSPYSFIISQTGRFTERLYGW
jgi:hypothetical protein